LPIGDSGWELRWGLSQLVRRLTSLSKTLGNIVAWRMGLPWPETAGRLCRIMKTHDIVVVGAGSGGLAAAAVAKFRGASVCIVQDGPVGGDCTWTGCIPSKALLAAAARGESFDDAMKSLRRAVNEIAAAETVEILRSEGYTVVEARGTVLGEGKVDVGGEIVRGRNVVVSPGSRPGVPPIPGLNSVPFVTNEQVFELDRLPESLAIIGGGPIGCEMAQAFSALGSTVTLVEGEQRLLPRDDAAASAVAEDALAASGVTVRIGVSASAVERVPGGVSVALADGSNLVTSLLLVATGRSPSHSDMGLAEAGVEFDDRGWIVVDRHLQTAAPGVWAIGDALGSTQFTHAAAHMARLAVENALGVGITRFRKHRFDPGEIPWVTFMSPEVAQVGVTEEAAREIKGARVAELPLSELDRAVAVNRTMGFVKLIAAPRPVIGFAGGGRLIGATIVADRAGEMIGEAALAIRTGMFAGRLAQTVHPYPTWSIAIQMAASQFVGTYNGRTARPPVQPS